MLILMVLLVLSYVEVHAVRSMRKQIEEESCPSDCSGNGFCLHGQCICKDGFRGSSCSKAMCADDCNHHGVCQDGICACDEGYVGSSCGFMACPQDCNRNGYCHVDTEFGLTSCSCFPGFSGQNCSVGEVDIPGRPVDSICPNECGEGECVEGICYCPPGLTGPACEQVTCPFGCSGRGSCDSELGVCTCTEPYTGVGCREIKCPDDCTGNFYGSCDTKFGVCECKPGFFGDNCSPDNCESDCNGHGECLNHLSGRPTCHCHDGWDGYLCDEMICDPEHTGKNCEERICHSNCTGPDHGTCGSDFTCECKEGWTGPGCSLRTCKNDCSGHGQCDDGVCTCTDSFTGEICDVPPPPCEDPLCSSKGTCVAGECFCKDGFFGKNCQLSRVNLLNIHDGDDSYDCDPVCGPQGSCIQDGTFGTWECQCKDGYTGISCDLAVTSVETSALIL